jgi:hypothetical protein
VRREVGGDPLPGTVGPQLPRVGLVEECPVEDPGDPTLEAGLADGHHDLHPAVEVALHQIG